MALQNIGASNKDDAFYRYKMPKMISKTEGKGNGIKTNVVNMVEIAKALARPASYTTKYFGNELGAQSKFDEKTGTSLVNGAHDTAKLASLLENFIRKYVQCYGCGNPETEIVITKTQMITLKCAACGFVSDVDMRDKLTTFILKHPPEQKKSLKNTKAMRRAEKERLNDGEAADKKQKKHKRDAVKKKGTSGHSQDLKSTSTKKKGNSLDKDHSPARSRADDHDQVSGDDDDDDDVQWQTDTSLEAAQQRIQEQLNSVTANMVVLTTNEVKPKSTKKSSKLEVKAHENGAKSIDTHERLVCELKEYLKKGSSADELKSFLLSLSGTFQEVMNALFAALFEGVDKGFAKEVNKKEDYLKAAIKVGGSQIVLLHAIESFCGKASHEVVKDVGLVLKSLYDNNVLEEDFILEWYEKGVGGDNKNSSFWKRAKPLVVWLENAEPESSEDDE